MSRSKLVDKIIEGLNAPSDQPGSYDTNPVFNSAVFEFNGQSLKTLKETFFRKASITICLEKDKTLSSGKQFYEITKVRN